jgi:hypothetical protein
VESVIVAAVGLGLWIWARYGRGASQSSGTLPSASTSPAAQIRSLSVSGSLAA